MIIYYDSVNQMRTTSDGGKLTASKPVLHYMEQPEWEIRIRDDDREPVDLSGVAAFRAAVDKDLNAGTEVMARTLDSAIDSTDKAEGIVRVPINANTATFLAAVNGKESLAAWFELWGFDSGGTPVFYMRFAITASSVVDPAGGSELQPAADTIAGSEARGMIAALAARVAALENRNAEAMILSLRRPAVDDPLFLKLYVSSTGSTADMTAAVDTATAAGRALAKVYAVSEGTGTWEAVPATGLTADFAGAPVRIDLSHVAGLPGYIFYRWETAEGSDRDFDSLFFPSSGINE